MGSHVVFGYTVNDWNIVLAIAASIAAICTLFITLTARPSASSLPQKRGIFGVFSGFGWGIAIGETARSRDGGLFSAEVLRQAAESAPHLIDPTVGHVVGSGIEALNIDDVHRHLEHADPLTVVDVLSNVTGH